MGKNRRNRRSRRRQSNQFHGERQTFAVISAGKSVTGFADGIHFPVDRAVRIKSITGRVTIFRGYTGLVEVVLFNQASTQVSTSGVKSVGTNGINISVRPPAGADMWIDPGRSQAPDLKIFHVDFPCVNKDMATYQILVNLTIRYVAGKEQIDNICPAVLVENG